MAPDRESLSSQMPGFLWEMLGEALSGDACLQDAGVADRMGNGKEVKVGRAVKIPGSKGEGRKIRPSKAVSGRNCHQKKLTLSDAVS